MRRRKLYIHFSNYMTNDIENMDLLKVQNTPASYTISPCSASILLNYVSSQTDVQFYGHNGGKKDNLCPASDGVTVGLCTGSNEG